MRMNVEELLQTPYHIIDILPAQVPADSPGQFFATERWFLEKDRLKAVKQKHIELILKLNCYRDIRLDEDGPVNPPPEQTAETMRKRYVCIMTGDSMIISEPDDTHMTLFNADAELLSLVRTLAAGEGLYVWRPEEKP